MNVARWTAASVLMISTIGSCSTSGGGEQHPAEQIVLPCNPATTSISIGQSSPPDRLATFRTDGNPIYISVSGFLHDQGFDPKIGSTAIYLGPATELPTYDAQRNIVTNLQTQVTAREGSNVRVDLPAGDYWLWSSNHVSITLESCIKDGITNVTPAPQPGAH